MNVKVVTDSTCDLPASIIAQYDIAVIPVYINMDGQSHLDGLDLTREEFYRRLPDLKTPATTSAPGPGAFAETYERLVAGGATGIISIHISPTLSNVLNAATLAAETIKTVPVVAFDGRQISLGTGFLVMAAARAAVEGRSLAEIVALLSEYVKRVYVVAALDTVEFLRRSGRMSGFQSGVASLLKIKPVLKMHDGVATSEKVRTSGRALNRLIETIAGLGPLDQLALVHTRAAEGAMALWEQTKQLFPHIANPISVDVTPVLGAHLGPGVVGFACVTAGSE